MQTSTQAASNLMSNSLRSMQIDHICLNVPNYEETLQWYQEKLDATIEHEWTVDIFPDLKLAYLNVHGFRIEIVGCTQPLTGMPVATSFGNGLRTTGIGHFCFRVHDVDAVLAELNRRGVKTFVECGELVAAVLSNQHCSVQSVYNYQNA
jgi:methylmalonyl-CoA/ethylmalonyl-CoA epimerase